LTSIELTEHGDLPPETILRHYELRYFADSAPIQNIRVVPMDNAACYVLEENCLYVSEASALSWKLIRIVILHELIHRKLLAQNGDPDPDEGDRFQAEVQRLWDAGAYRRLL
jgi:hypothetical protein